MHTIGAHISSHDSSVWVIGFLSHTDSLMHDSESSVHTGESDSFLLTTHRQCFGIQQQICLWFWHYGNEETKTNKDHHFHIVFLK